MVSTPDTKQTDPHNVSPGLSTQGIELVGRADERLAHAYEQIARANEQISKLRCRGIPFFGSEDAREQISSAIARQAGATRLHRPAVDSVHLCRCFRFAVLWRDGQAGDLPVGTATDFGFVVAVGKTGARSPAEPAYRSGGCGGCSTFAITTSRSGRTARRGAGGRPDPSRADAVAPDDGA